MANTHTIDHLQELQALPLKLKVRLTQQRIREWVSEFGTDGVYVSFSGGKDSTVLLHIVRELYPDIPAVFCDTGLEYPEIRQFVKTFDNVVWLKPKKNFFQVCEEYGFPLISKEVSECVYGARKYLTSVLEQESLDRQTDRQTDRQHRMLSSIARCADAESMRNRTRGGYDRKYRKLRGLGEFSKFSESPSKTEGEVSQEQIWSVIKYAENNGFGSGGTVRDFANLTGIRTADNKINPRLWSGYQQYASAEASGDSVNDRDGDDGDYP